MPQPNNLDTLSAVQFKFEIFRIPNVSYFMQTAMLPGVEMDSPFTGSPRKNWQLTGSKLTFEPMILTFIVDEDMANYLELYRWMQEMIRTDDEEANKSDGSLFIMNGQMNQKLVARFTGIFPVSITELSFGTNDSDNITTVATVTFNYNYFDFPDVSTSMGNDDLSQNNISLKT